MKTLEEAQSIAAGNKELLCNVKHVILRLLPTADVVLYGSVARGVQEQDSDYDVLVLTDRPLSKDLERAVERAILGLELDRGIVVSTIYYTREEWDTPVVRVSPFHAEVERDAVLL